MRQSIPSVLFQGIQGNHWVEISYLNAKNKMSYFTIGIKDVDIKNQKIICDIFNLDYETYGGHCMEKPSPLSLTGIKSASVMEQSYYPTPKELRERMESDTMLQNFLESYQLDNNILCYLSDCYKFDNDPYIKDGTTLDGVDLKELKKNKLYKLDDKQFKSLLDNVFKESSFEKQIAIKTLAMNVLSVTKGNKSYVIAYRPVTLNFKDRTLNLSNHSVINKSFLVEGQSISLSSLIDVDPQEFVDNFDENSESYINELRSNIRESQMVDTRPIFFLIQRDAMRGVDETFEAIAHMEQEKSLTQPLKAFFGNSKSGRGTSKEANIVVYDRQKINIDQMRVVYNAMINHVTYVKGPPGTGKTETLFNVILSSYANKKKVLVCSNNNHPVDDIKAKLSCSFVLKGNSKYSDKPFNFPFLRLGNNDEMEEAVKTIQDDFKRAATLKGHTSEERTDQTKDKMLSNFSGLKNLLMKYEEIQELKDTYHKLLKIQALKTTDRIREKIDQQIELKKKQIEELGVIKNDDIRNLAISAKDDSDFQSWLYFSALIHTKRLTGERFKELKDIVFGDNPVTNLNKYLRDSDNLRKLTDVYPVILCTNNSCEKLGAPKPDVFDLCIMDEAGQCNMAVSLIPIIRCTDLLLVGDTNQLQPVTVIDEELNRALIEKYSIHKEYNYVQNSILSCMTRKDNNSKNILLSYHYRCGKKIANFVNQRFYGDELKIQNPKDGNLQFHDVKNVPTSRLRNAYDVEANEVVEVIKKNNYKDVGIITPFNNQAALINKKLKEAGLDKDIKAGTVHSLQGSEKSVIVMSSALSPQTSPKAAEWVKDNHELINVAVTRAKDTFIFVGDREAINKTEKPGEVSDLKALMDYTLQHGEYIVPKSTKVIMADFSNNSVKEEEFFETIRPYFTKKNCKFMVERNVLAKDLLKNALPEDVEKCGLKEFDVVIKAKDGFFARRYAPVVVIEIDGGEHVGSNITVKLDRQKEELCSKYGIKLIRVPNYEVKDYELIIKIFESTIGQLDDIDEAEGINLFDFDYSEKSRQAQG